MTNKQPNDNGKETVPQAPTNGMARELYFLGRDNPEKIEEAFERAREGDEGEDDE